MTIPVGFAQVTHLFTGQNAPTGAAVTYGVDPAVGATPVDVATAAASAWFADVLPNQVGSITLTETHVKFGPDDTGPAGVSTVGGPGGGLSAEGWSPQIAILVHKNTDLGGRRGRGRMYVPGYSEEWVNQLGILVPADLVTLQGDFTTLFNTLEGSAAIDGIVLLHSPSSPGTENPTPEPVPTPVTSFIVSGTVATQRRRLRR